MKGQRYVRSDRTASIAMAAGLMLAALPGSASAADTQDVASLPLCGDLVASLEDDGRVVVPWRVELDEEGTVAGHRLTLRHGGDETKLRAGRRGFATLSAPDRLLIGQRDARRTSLTMVDTRRACRLWTRSLARLAYPQEGGVEDDTLRLTMHDPATRSFQGTLSVDIETGASTGLVDGECIEACLPNDGDISPGALEPAGAPRPTPNFSAGGWAKDKRLPYRWGPGGVPPRWAKSALWAAAADAWLSAFARSPRFVYDRDAVNAVAYTGNLPSYCSSNAIACAGRNMPTSWGVWLRPDGTDYAWGTLRWCQKTSSAERCLDIRRVLLHELGHITGLTHPSTAGFTLSAGDSVMQGITPMRPRPGSSRHALGRCDVATLQELYDTPDNKTAISDCNDVATRLTLVSSKAAVDRGDKVTLTAQLQVADWNAYRQLAGNPLNGRSVKLKYRRAGSSDAWRTAWMQSQYSSGRYKLTISPGAHWEFRAVFPAPGDEGLRYSRSKDVKVRVRK